jgi:hypothetical protein
MRWMRVLVVFGLLLTKASATIEVTAEQEKYCLLDVCLGDDVRDLNVSWVPNPPTLQEQLDAKALMQARSVSDIYHDRNELLITTDAVRAQLFPYLIRRQVFDASVLNTLTQVQAFCSSTTLTGELVQANKREHILVTFRVEPVKGGQARLRVVVLEKQFDIMSSVLRPEDRKREVLEREAIKQRFSQVKEVRDLDARFAGIGENFAPVLMGYRFFSESRIPFTLRMRDLTDFEMMEESRHINPLCKQDVTQ